MMNIFNVIVPLRSNKMINQRHQNDKHAEIESILQKCHSKTISIDYLFYLLVEYFDHLGIRNFIINYLFEVEVHSIMFYIPQLCYMNILYPKTFLEKLLIETCKSSTEFFICVN